MICGKYLQNRIIPLTYLTPPLLIEALVPKQGNEWSYIRVGGIDSASLYDLSIGFGIVPSLVFLVFHLI